MRKFFAAALVLTLLLTGCAPVAAPEQTRYTATFLDLFDTVTTIIGQAESEAAFQAMVQPIHDSLEHYHKLFDIYHDYEGIHNLKTVNDQAGLAPVQVDGAIVELLQDCKAYYDLTDGKVNVAMGSVLSLWHEARTDGLRDPSAAKLPDVDALVQAASHMDIECLIIDEAASTVFLSDLEMSLDVGAIAKGWSVQKVAENAPSGMLISVGGNVCATGPKLKDGTPWVVGIQDPDAPDRNLHTIYVTKGSVVTSGDYQRTYMVDGKPYHHIIDPETRMPADLWRSVSIVCADSALADALSTALFLMDRETGEVLAEACDADVLWVMADGTEYMTAGFQEALRN